MSHDERDEPAAARERPVETVRSEDVPAIGLGTWRLSGESCRRTVETALELGYRLVDTAQYYGNERDVGAAIAASDVDREDLFVVTKLKVTNAGYEKAVASTERSLDRLGLDRVDLLLLHWPNPLVDVADTMRAFADLRERGLVSNVGFSNFSLKRLRRARRAGDVPVFADQVQCHPYRVKRDLAEYCVGEDLLLMAYSPLGHGGVVRDDVLAEVGRPYGKSAAQVALRWAVQRDNVVPIPKASSREHLAANLDVFDFALTPEEMNRVERPSLVRTGLTWLRGRLGV